MGRERLWSPKGAKGREKRERGTNASFLASLVTWPRSCCARVASTVAGLRRGRYDPARDVDGLFSLEKSSQGGAVGLGEEEEGMVSSFFE
jgi:hypothetical protein